MLLSRQKLIVSIISSFGGKLSATDFQKYLFLFTQTCENDKSFDFVPYKYGCFSFQSMADKRKLIEKGILKETSDWELTDLNQAVHGKSDKETAYKLFKFTESFKVIKGKKLIQYVYRTYPYYAINSEIASEHLTNEELKKVLEVKPKLSRSLTFATIGYEGASIESYINKLIINDIRTLVDVRKNPISRKYGFSKKTLSSLLERVGIEYIHIPQLGIESSERQELNTQKDYDKLFNHYEHEVLTREQDSIRALHQIYLDKKRIAITCFEKNVCQCHRGRVAKSVQEFSNNSIEIQHL